MPPNRCFIPLVALLNLLGLGCSRSTPAPPPNPTTVAPDITVITPQQRSITWTIVVPGTTQAFEETALCARIPAYVRSIAEDPDKRNHPSYDRGIDIGSRVKAGQVLAELAAPELEEEQKQKAALVRQVEAEILQAQKALAVAEAAVAAAKAQVVQARAAATRAQALYDRWHAEMERINRLVASGLIDTQTRDETLHQFQAAEATRQEANAQVQSAEAAVARAIAERDKAAADIAAVQARREVARAEERRLAALCSYCRLVAPYDGVITRRSVHPGDFVTPNQQQPLFTLSRIDPVRVVLQVPEADAGWIREGQMVQVTLPGDSTSLRTAPVIRTAWSLQPPSRTLRVELDLPNADGQVRPGMYLSARIPVELPPHWSVPSAAIARIHDEPVMYLAENGKAARVAVQLHRGDGRYVQILRYRRSSATEWSPITGQERIAIPATALTDGQALP
jgi:multidrug resistance efflux pump